MQINQLILGGYVQDVKIGSNSRGEYALFTVKQVQGTGENRRTSYFDALCTGDRSVDVLKQMQKGDPVYVQGKIEQRETEYQGVKFKQVRVFAFQVGRPLPASRQDGGGQGGGQVQRRTVHPAEDPAKQDWGEGGQTPF